MATLVDSRDAGQARASRRVQTTTAGVTTVAATGVVTFPAGYLDSLENGDVVQFSGITGTHLQPATDYYLIAERIMPAGQTAVQVSLTLNGPPVIGGTNVTAASVVHGRLTQAADGVLAGSHGPSGN